MTIECRWCKEEIYEGIPEGKRRIYAHKDSGLRSCGNLNGHIASPVITERQVFNVYRNTRFTKRNYECTNVAACIPVDESAKVPEGYEVAPSSILSNMTPLWIEGGIQYWGWM